MRVCIDWPSGEGVITADPEIEVFMEREGLERPERVHALAVLRAGHTYQDRRCRWSLTPLTERTP